MKHYALCQKEKVTKEIFVLFYNSHFQLFIILIVTSTTLCTNETEKRLARIRDAKIASLVFAAKKRKERILPIEITPCRYAPTLQRFLHNKTLDIRSGSIPPSYYKSLRAQQKQTRRLRVLLKRAEIRMHEQHVVPAEPPDTVKVAQKAAAILQIEASVVQTLEVEQIPPFTNQQTQKKGCCCIL